MDFGELVEPLLCGTASDKTPLLSFNVRSVTCFGIIGCDADGIELNDSAGAGVGATYGTGLATGAGATYGIGFAAGAGAAGVGATYGTGLATGAGATYGTGFAAGAGAAGVGATYGTGLATGAVEGAGLAAGAGAGEGTDLTAGDGAVVGLICGTAFDKTPFLSINVRSVTCFGTIGCDADVIVPPGGSITKF